MMKLATTAMVVMAAVALAPRADAWTISQNFDSSSVGAACGWDAAGGSKVSNIQKYSGANSCQLNVTAGQTAYGMWGGVLQHPTALKQGSELWFRVRTFMPNGFNYNSNGEGNHLKFFRFHTATPSGGNAGYDDIYINPKGMNPPFQFIYEGEQVWDMLGTSTGTLTNVVSGGNQDAIQLGVWETYEYYVKFDTRSKNAGGQAEVRFWKNGALMGDFTDRITLSVSTDIVDQTNLFTYWNGGAPATESMYVDDLVLTSDTPSGRDAAGHPYIGVGAASSSSGGSSGGSTTVTPDPPTSVTVQ
jgi:hypothetical protein